MRARAYAKINIGLLIGGQRPDGYHSIETVFHRIDCFDTISFAPSRTIEFTSDDPALGQDSSNLCVRAARLLQEHLHTDEGVAMRLEKRIPIGAGLGGGSSDAATVLSFLNKQWRGGLQSDELRSLGARLGSDIPYFFHTGSAYATGRGDLLEPLEIRLPFWIAVVTPPVHISTAWAYAHCRTRSNDPQAPLKNLLHAGLTGSTNLAPAVVNDFEETVFEAHPEIGAVKAGLLRAGAVVASLTGSGSSVFGFFSTELEARRALSGFVAPFRSSLTPPFFSLQSAGEVS